MELMLLQQATTQTSGYMIAGYGVIFGVMLVYLASLVVRQRKLRQELQILQADENKEHLEG
jgi:CcmD family protein